MLMRSKKATPFAEIKAWWTRSAKKVTRFVETKGWRTKGSDTMGGPWAIGLVVCLVAAVVLITARSEITNAAPERTERNQPVAQMARATEMPAPPVARTEVKATAGLKDSAKESSLATITGCLERSGQSFRLEDTGGAQAPKSRSWKTGFLRKGAASVGVVDSANKLNLSNHIGERVSLTGMLTDRELKASSVRRVADSCD
jgi:hypothetical protein